MTNDFEHPNSLKPKMYYPKDKFTYAEFFISHSNIQHIYIVDKSRDIIAYRLRKQRIYHFSFNLKSYFSCFSQFWPEYTGINKHLNLK